jgi:hypothetical protein
MNSVSPTNISDHDFDRPSGTGPLCTATQALRAWLRSACPSGTGGLTTSLPRHLVPGYDQPVPPGQKPFAPRLSSEAGGPGDGEAICGPRIAIEERRSRGGRRDSNPQHPEPQSGALPLSYDHHIGAEKESSASSGSAKLIFSGSRRARNATGRSRSVWRRIVAIMSQSIMVHR